jgi:MFS transporter, PAT family, beta-lactamase induction signal transducer AmpG
MNTSLPLRTLTSITLMGFTSGLPFLLTQSTLQTWLATSDVSLTYLGWTSLIGLPYLLKCLWSPYLDRIKLPRSTLRLGWMQLAQIALTLSLFALSYLDTSHLRLIMFTSVLIAFFAATQDIVVDGYRIEQLTTKHYGWGILLTQIGFRLAMIVSGAGVLILAYFTSWAFAYRASAMLMGLMFIIGFFFHQEAPLPTTNKSQEWLAPWRALWAMPHKTTLLALLACYPMADQLTTSLMPTYLIRVAHLNEAQVGLFYKTWGLGATLAGSACAAYTVTRFSMRHNLALYAALLAMSFIGFAVFTQSPHSISWLIVILGGNQLMHGASTTALVTLMSQLCQKPFCASHYACFTSVSGLSRVFLGPLASWLILHFGWQMLFESAVLLLGLTTWFVLAPATKKISAFYHPKEL